MNNSGQGNLPTYNTTTSLLAGGKFAGGGRVTTSVTVFDNVCRLSREALVALEMGRSFAASGCLSYDTARKFVGGLQRL